MKTRLFLLRAALTVVSVGLAVGGAVHLLLPPSEPLAGRPEPPRKAASFEPRRPLDVSGYALIMSDMKAWTPDAPLEKVAESWDRVGYRKADSHSHASAA